MIVRVKKFPATTGDYRKETGSSACGERMAHKYLLYDRFLIPRLNPTSPVKPLNAHKCHLDRILADCFKIPVHNPHFSVRVARCQIHSKGVPSLTI